MTPRALTALALAAAVAAPASAAVPTVYQVARVQRPIVAGAVANLEVCVANSSAWRVGCAPPAATLKARAVTAVAKIGNARPGAPVACSLEFAAVQASAWTFAGRAGANYLRPARRNSHLAAYHRLEASAAVIRARCFRGR